jgi:hypothetical protein
MSAEEYMREIVEPTIKDMVANCSSRRHAFLACVATYHTIDYLAAPKTGKTLVNKFRRESAAFLAIDRIAHAFKHGHTGHQNSLVKPLLAKDVRRRPATVPGKMILGTTPFNYSGGVRAAKEVKDILELVNEAADFLRGKIQEAESR